MTNHPNRSKKENHAQEIKASIKGRKIRFTSDGGSVVIMTRKDAEKQLADLRDRFPKIASHRARETVAATIRTYETAVELAVRNGI